MLDIYLYCWVGFAIACMFCRMWTWPQKTCGAVLAFAWPLVLPAWLIIKATTWWAARVKYNFPAIVLPDNEIDIHLPHCDTCDFMAVEQGHCGTPTCTGFRVGSSEGTIFSEPLCCEEDAVSCGAPNCPRTG